jgi:hypothetical protein
MFGDKNAGFGNKSERRFNNLTITKVSFPNGTHSFTITPSKGGDGATVEIAATPSELVLEFKAITAWLESMF